MSVAEFTLAGARFRLSAPGADARLRLPDDYTPFLADAGGAPPEADYEVAPFDPTPAAVGSGELLWDNGLWRLRAAGSASYDIDIHDVMRHDWRQVATVARDFSTGRLLPSPYAQRDGALFPFHQPQDRTIVLGRLCHLGGVMVHASCVMTERRAVLFAGMSGAGKTTLARLWRSHGATILNDERNLLRPHADGVQAGASPWHGEENQVNAVTGPLAAVFYPKQAASNAARPLPVAESLARLLTMTFIPVFLPDGPRRTLDTLAAILERVPSYELTFTPDARALDVVRAAIG